MVPYTVQILKKGFDCKLLSTIPARDHEGPEELVAHSDSKIGSFNEAVLNYRCSCPYPKPKSLFLQDAANDLSSNVLTISN